MQTHRIAVWVCAVTSLVAVLLLAPSCAQVAGLGDLERVDCLDNCDGGDGSTGDDSGGGGDSGDGGGGGDSGDGAIEAGCPMCSGATPACDMSTNTCVACVSNADCAAGTICVNKACKPGCAADHPTCVASDGGRGDCDLDAGVCRQCLNDGDCSGANPRCDTATFQCVACLPMNDNCAIGHRCVQNGPGQYTCAMGCRTVADCFPDGGAPDAGDGGDAGAGPIACCNNTCINTAVNDSNCGACGSACGGDGGAATTCCSSTCHDKQTDPNNCGGCAIACSGNHIPTRTCSAGTCNGACAAGYTDCNANKQTDGCETATGTDPNNCGGCGTVCSNRNITTPTCAGGVCNGTCLGGTADCNNNKQTDGCETSISSDPNNCGACGTVCSANNMATRTCGSGVCNGTCAAGTADCNNNKLTDGCEADINNDPNNCGGCGIVCSANNMGTRTCANGVCNGTCLAGFADCNMNKQTDGCEVNTATDPSNCGSCGAGCSSNHMATVTCGAGSCNGTCAAGYSDCNSNKRTDGCETATGTDPNNCGGCGVVCSNNNMATRTCGSGVCNGNCIPGTADCNANKQSDGCEVTTSTDPNNCGGCGTVCSTVNMATRTCASGACNGTCLSGFSDCTGNLQLNGCETATTTVTNCSGCGLACNTTNNTARSCNGTTCSYTCSPGRADCNAGTAPDTDGCECGVPSCGGNGCSGATACPTTTHSNGVGQSYYDCTPVGTLTSAQAMEACAAYAISQGKTAANCSDGWKCTGGPTTVCFFQVNGMTNQCTSYCWGYTSGKDQGWTTSCACPEAQIGTWN